MIIISIPIGNRATVHFSSSLETIGKAKFSKRIVKKIGDPKRTTAMMRWKHIFSLICSRTNEHLMKWIWRCKWNANEIKLLNIIQWKFRKSDSKFGLRFKLSFKKIKYIYRFLNFNWNPSFVRWISKYNYRLWNLLDDFDKMRSINVCFKISWQNQDHFTLSGWYWFNHD